MEILRGQHPRRNGFTFTPIDDLPPARAHKALCLLRLLRAEANSGRPRHWFFDHADDQSQTFYDLRNAEILVIHVDHQHPGLRSAWLVRNNRIGGRR